MAKNTKFNPHIDEFLNKHIIKKYVVINDLFYHYKKSLSKKDKKRVRQDKFYEYVIKKFSLQKVCIMNVDTTFKLKSKQRYLDIYSNSLKTEKDIILEELKIALLIQSKSTDILQNQRVTFAYEQYLSFRKNLNSTKKELTLQNFIQFITKNTAFDNRRMMARYINYDAGDTYAYNRRHTHPNWQCHLFVNYNDKLYNISQRKSITEFLEKNKNKIINRRTSFIYDKYYDFCKKNNYQVTSRMNLNRAITNVLKLHMKDKQAKNITHDNRDKTVKKALKENTKKHYRCWSRDM